MTSIQDKIKELIKNTPIVELMFSALDKNGDGNLDIDEFKTQSKMQNPNSITDNLYLEGAINLGHFKEYINRTPDFAVSAPDMMPINQTFSMVDKDNSDSISREELGSVGFKDLGLELFFSLFDSDKNGSVNVSEIMSVLADNLPNSSPVAPNVNQPVTQVDMNLEANAPGNAPRNAPGNAPGNAPATTINPSLCKVLGAAPINRLKLYKLAFMLLDVNNNGEITGEQYKSPRFRKVNRKNELVNTYGGIEGYFSPADITPETKISFDTWERALSGSVQNFHLDDLNSKLSDLLYDANYKYMDLEDKLLYCAKKSDDEEKYRLVLEILSHGFKDEINQKTINDIMIQSGCKEGGGRKIRSNKGKKRGSYKSRKANNVTRHPSGRKVRSNKGKKRGPYGSRTGRTRSGKAFR